jgi:hydroxymethylglutaryl-CoA reductase (NADPH)
MPTIPSMLLKKLYQKGSLKNTEGGFEFALKNTLAPGTIVGLRTLVVDGQKVDPAQIEVSFGGKTWPAEQVSVQNPLDFAINLVVMVRVKGGQLAAGPHKIYILPNTKEVGELDIEIADTVG